MHYIGYNAQVIVHCRYTCTIIIIIIYDAGINYTNLFILLHWISVTHMSMCHMFYI